ncbi:MAG: universal stress protein [Rhodocyclaceae bacterium]|nr:universal stress protein [Rhodocyclaceae bacterium]
MNAARPIAVAVDGSPASDAPLAEALRLAQAGNRPLIGIFVLDTGWVDYIGNDWQSAAGARQGFLDYIRDQLETQAEAARAQFAAATRDHPAAHFTVIPGDPLETLCKLMARGEAETLIAGKEAFQVCGRPSVKTLARDLAQRVPSLRIV